MKTTNDKLEQLKQAITEVDKNLVLKKYWGPEAHCYGNHYEFPKEMTWEDIYPILSWMCVASHSIYLKIDKESFADYSWEQKEAKIRDVEKRYGEKAFDMVLELDEEYFSYQAFVQQVLYDGFVQVKAQYISPDRIILRKVTHIGGQGDEDGFGVEPDFWASAVLDGKGCFVQPFTPGCIYE